jgi:hypothetical protein
MPFRGFGGGLRNGFGLGSRRCFTVDVQLRLRLTDVFPVRRNTLKGIAIAN